MTTDTNSRVVFGMVAGVVTDTGPKKEVHAPVVDARIDLYGPSETALRGPSDYLAGSAHTDANGYYAIDGLRPGNYWVSCEAFTPKGQKVQIEEGYTARADFQLDVGLHLACLIPTGTGGVHSEIEKCTTMEAGTPIRLRAEYNRKLKNPTVIKFAASQGVLAAIPDCPDETMLLTTGGNGPIEFSVTIAEANSPSITAKSSFVLIPAQARP